jgi:tRNA threonylcarbamoyladenosine biosynthesis protein TsaE
MAELTLETTGPRATQKLGETLAGLLEAGDVILLSGELGAGKTCLVQGVAKGLGFTGPVTSKSFVLVGEYAGRLKLYHADLFRLDSAEAVEDLGLKEYTRNGVLMVEWAERAWDALPEEYLGVGIDITGPRRRRINFKANSQRYQRVLESLNRKES